MEEALKTLAGQGVVGALLVLFILAIVYLQKKRDGDGEARLKEARETLITAAETNRMLSVLRDAVAGVTQSMTSLTTTVQTMHADSSAAREQGRQRDDRVERMIERNSEFIREIDAVVRDNAKLIEKANAALDQIIRARP